MLSKSSSGNFGLSQISWMFVATLLLLSALALASPEDWDKRLYRGLGKRSTNYAADDFQTVKRLKMPLEYKRLKFFGAQNSQPAFGRRDFNGEATGEYFE